MTELALVLMAVSAVLVLAPAVAFACGSDSDCKIGHCSGGSCGHCGSDYDCTGRSRCSSGKCGSCRSDSDCKGGRCSSGKCSNRDDYLRLNQSGPSALQCTP